jgi:hypothetical protein
MISALSSACGLIDPTQQMASIIVCAFALLLGLSQAYSPSLCTTTSGHSRRSSTSTMQATKKKWTKQRTLADASGEGVGSLGAAAVGLKGSIPVKFKQGETELTTMALVGQPLSDVATQVTSRAPQVLLRLAAPCCPRVCAAPNARRRDSTSSTAVGRASAARARLSATASGSGLAPPRCPPSPRARRSPLCSRRAQPSAPPRASSSPSDPSSQVRARLRGARVGLPCAGASVTTYSSRAINRLCPLPKTTRTTTAHAPGARNNLLGMLGFVTRRRAAKENFQERLDLEGLVAQRTKEIKAARLAAEAAQKK